MWRVEVVIKTLYPNAKKCKRNYGISLDSVILTKEGSRINPYSSKIQYFLISKGNPGLFRASQWRNDGNQSRKEKSTEEMDLFVYIFPVSDFQYEDHKHVIFLPVYYSIIPHSQSISIFLVSLHFFDIESWLLICQSLYLIENPHHILIRYFIRIFGYSSSIGDFILWRHLFPLKNVWSYSMPLWHRAARKSLQLHEHGVPGFPWMWDFLLAWEYYMRNHSTIK